MNDKTALTQGQIDNMNNIRDAYDALLEMIGVAMADIDESGECEAYDRMNDCVNFGLDVNIRTILAEVATYTV